MTTTTFTAPAVLLWVQLKVLRWHFISLFSLGLLMAYSPSWLGMDSLFNLLIPTVAVLAGAFVFGSEYAHGSQDYLATRPVSARVVFAVKVAAVLGIWISALWLVDLWTSKRPYSVFLDFAPLPLIMALCLGLSFWIGAVSILLRDGVRGVLYGTPTFLVVLVSGGLLLSYLISVIAYLCSGIDWHPLWLHAYFNPIFLYLAGLLSPLWFLGVLSQCWRFGRTRSLRLTGSSILGGVLFAWFILLFYGIQSTEGRIRGIRYDEGGLVLAAVKDQDRLYWVEWTSPASKGDERYRILSLNHRRRSEEFKVHASLTFDASPSISRVPKVVLTQDRLLLIRDRGRILNLYSWGEDSPLEQIHEKSASNLMIEGSFPIWESEDVVTFYPRRDWRHEDPFEPVRIDLSSGAVEILPATMDAAAPESLPDLENDEIVIRDMPGMKCPTIVYETVDSTTHSLMFPALGFHARVGESIAAVVPPDWDASDPAAPETDYFKPLTDRNLDDVRIYDLRNPSTPVIVPPPLQVVRYIKLLDILGFIRCLPDNARFGTPVIAMGGGFLSVWNQNPYLISLWDVSDPSSPAYIGSAAYSPYNSGWPVSLEGGGYESDFSRFSIEPVIREDGALGYLTTGGTLRWLEFPALMKEADPS